MVTHQMQIDAIVKWLSDTSIDLDPTLILKPPVSIK